MRHLVSFALLLGSCGQESPDEPDEISTAPSEPVEETPQCESESDLGQQVPIEPPPGIEPCNGTTPYCQRLNCYECQEEQPGFFEWVAISQCDGDQ